MNQIIPRILLAAPSSGSGKTITTCGLLALLKRRGVDITSYKTGPDYIDPMFHRKVIGVPSRNLDTFFSERQEVCEQLSRSSYALIEGVMGLYDGLGGIRQEGSSYHLAAMTKTPIILILDAHGMGRTILAVLSGLKAYDTQGLIRGVILNRTSKMLYEQIAPLVESEVGIRPIGYLPKLKGLNLESRHLGLKLPEEAPQLREQVELVADALEETVDIEALLQIMESAEPLACAQERMNRDIEDMELAGMIHQKLYGAAEQEAAVNGQHLTCTDMPQEKTAASSYYEQTKAPLRLAVARDEAFCFYYEANLELLQECGAEVVYFSPIHDAHLPENISGLLLGGGYPELAAEALSRNETMLANIRQAIASGMPSLAECGGFLYLHEELQGENGTYYPMAGVIKGRSYNTGKLCRFGYVEIHSESAKKLPMERSITLSEDRQILHPEKNGNLMEPTPEVSSGEGLLHAGETIKAHEFHYYDSENNGTDCTAVKPVTGRSWPCIHQGENHLWGFPHLYYPSCRKMMERFVEAMQRWDDRRQR